MIESILNSVKEMIGPLSADDHFNHDIITHINTTFSILTQLGVGPRGGFKITGDSEVWSDYLPDGSPVLEMVRDYVFMKARLYFDPPTMSALLTSLENNISELEWRLNVYVDPEDSK